MDKGITIPQHYISIRITTPHANWASVYDVIKDEPWYISYPHFGKKGDNEHFHVFTPGGTVADRERIRARFKRAGFTGNKCICVKLGENGITSGIQYGSRERTQPRFAGENVDEWIRISPPWDPNLAKKRKRDSDDYVQLTCMNVIRYAFEYWKDNNIKSTDLPKVVEIMLQDGKYVFSSAMMRQGAPSWQIDVFRESCEAGRLVYNSEIFRTAIWRDFSSRY